MRKLGTLSFNSQQLYELQFTSFFESLRVRSNKCVGTIFKLASDPSIKSSKLFAQLPNYSYSYVLVRVFLHVGHIKLWHQNKKQLRAVNHHHIIKIEQYNGHVVIIKQKTTELLHINMINFIHNILRDNDK